MTKSPENADPRLRQAVKTGTNNDTGKMPVPRDFNGLANRRGNPLWLPCLAVALVHTGRRGRRPSRSHNTGAVRPDGADGLGVGGVLDSFLPGRDGVRHENHPGRCRPTAMGRSEEFSSEIVNMIAVVLEEERPCSVCLRGVLLEVVGVLFWLFWSVGD